MSTANKEVLSRIVYEDAMRYSFAELKYFYWVSALERLRLSPIEGPLSSRMLSNKYAYIYCDWICVTLSISK